MFDLLGPGNIRNMNQTVNALVNAHKNAEIRNVFDLSFNNGTDGIFFRDNIPGVRLKLFNTQGNPLFGHIHAQHHGFNRIADAEEF